MEMVQASEIVSQALNYLEKGGDIMTLRRAFKKYPDSYVVLEPRHRDARTNKPLTFRALTSCDTEEEAERARLQYSGDGLQSVFILQTHSPIIKELSPENTARMFRVLYGME